MAESKHQKTFLSSAELFNRAAKRCREAESGLRKQLRAADESARLEMSNVAKHEEHLARSLEGYIKHGPLSVLKTRVQYQLDSGLDKSIQSKNLNEAYENLLQLNKELIETFHDQALKSASPTVSEAMENMSAEIAAVNKQISMNRVTAQDM